MEKITLTDYFGREFTVNYMVEEDEHELPNNRWMKYWKYTLINLYYRGRNIIKKVNHNHVVEMIELEFNNKLKL